LAQNCLLVLTLEEAFPTRVAGIIRSDDADAAFHACLAAVDGGIATLEVTLTVPSCFDVIRGLIASTLSSVPVGVGTVWDASTVARAKRAGAAFVVTPMLLPEVAAACAREDILCVLGALTPTEIHRARLAGANVVKVFPIQSMGGPDYIRWLRGPMPDVPLWVSGGVEIDQVRHYLSLGVCAVGLTTALFPPEALQRRDMATITELARRAATATTAATGWVRAY
jgi:2-dehydro-3-deoxyphosphogluconate aldolase/(4S)-4-hydroxy-2-oxoglutarate aldolase